MKLQFSTIALQRKTTSCFNEIRHSVESSTSGTTFGTAIEFVEPISIGPKSLRQRRLRRTTSSISQMAPVMPKTEEPVTSGINL